MKQDYSMQRKISAVLAIAIILVTPAMAGKIILTTNRFVVLDDPNAGTKALGFFDPTDVRGGSWDSDYWSGESTTIRTIAVVFNGIGQPQSGVRVNFTLRNPNNTVKNTSQSTTDAIGAAYSSFNLDEQRYWGYWVIEANATVEGNNINNHTSFALYWWGCNQCHGKKDPGKWGTYTPKSYFTMGYDFHKSQDKQKHTEPMWKGTCIICHQMYNGTPVNYKFTDNTPRINNDSEYSSDWHNGKKKCQDCHAGSNMSITPQGKNPEIAGCYDTQGCHPKKNTNLTAVNSTTGYVVGGSYRTNYSYIAKAHTGEGVACIACHGAGHNITKPYNNTDSSDSYTENEQCWNCHADRLTTHYKSSRCVGCHSQNAHKVVNQHPNENCSDCHSTHGVTGLFNDPIKTTNFGTNAVTGDSLDPPATSLMGNITLITRIGQDWYQQGIFGPSTGSVGSDKSWGWTFFDENPPSGFITPSGNVIQRNSISALLLDDGNNSNPITGASVTANITYWKYDGVIYTYNTVPVILTENPNHRGFYSGNFSFYGGTTYGDKMANCNGCHLSIFGYPDTLIGYFPGNYTATVKAETGGKTATANVNFEVTPWGCEDCHGSGNPHKTISVDMDSACYLCHGINQIVHDYTDAGNPHQNTAHRNIGCTNCHTNKSLSYQTFSGVTFMNKTPQYSYTNIQLNRGTHSNLSCTDCHKNLTLPTPQGGYKSDNYTIDATVNNYNPSFAGIQPFQDYYVLNVTQEGRPLSISFDWVGAANLGFYLYPPNFNPRNGSYPYYNGATFTNKPERYINNTPMAGQWILVIYGYDLKDGWVWKGVLQPPINYTISTTYPIQRKELPLTPECNSCHNSDATGKAYTKYEIPNWNPGFAHADTNNDSTLDIQCRMCHDAMHNITIKGCSNCHTTAPLNHPVSEPQFSQYTVSQCLACHGDPHRVTRAGGGPDCISCHDRTGTAMHKIDASAAALGIHANLNSEAANDTGVPADNKKCWGCHQSDGTQPSGMGDRYSDPYTCLDCHGNASRPQQASEALNVTEHYVNGTKVRAVKFAPDNLSSCIFCHNKSEMKIGYEEPDTLWSNVSLISHYGKKRTDIFLPPNSTDCKYCHQNTSTDFIDAFVNINNTNITHDNGAPCRNCHGSGRLHNTTLSGGSCLACHGAGGASTKNNISSMDLGAHVNLSSLRGAGGENVIDVEDCRTCHFSSPHPNVSKANTYYCENCHRGSSNKWDISSTIQVGTFKHGLNNCASCHTANYSTNRTARVKNYHMGNALGAVYNYTKCLDCHNTYNGFDEPFHAPGMFRGTGGHLYDQSQCGTCHPDGTPHSVTGKTSARMTAIKSLSVPANVNKGNPINISLSACYATTTGTCYAFIQVELAQYMLSNTSSGEVVIDWAYMNASDGKFNSYTESAFANISTSSIPAGNYTLRVRAMSGAPRAVSGKLYYPLNGLMSAIMSRYVEVIYRDIEPPASVSDLRNTTYAYTYINWEWTDPRDPDFARVMVYLNGNFKSNVSKEVQGYNATDLSAGQEYTISTRTVDTAGNINQTWMNYTASTSLPPETVPPESITGLGNTSYAPDYITWTWTDPGDPDFARVMVYLNGNFKATVLNGVQGYNATGLLDGLEYTISTHTADIWGNVNETWVNHTAGTAYSAVNCLACHGAGGTSTMNNISSMDLGEHINLSSLRGTGGEGVIDAQDCKTCHFSFGFPHSSNVSKANTYYCENCHSGSSNKWGISSTIQVGTFKHGLNNCASCHTANYSTNRTARVKNYHVGNALGAVYNYTKCLDCHNTYNGFDEPFHAPGMFRGTGGHLYDQSQCGTCHPDGTPHSVTGKTSARVTAIKSLSVPANVTRGNPINISLSACYATSTGTCYAYIQVELAQYMLRNTSSNEVVMEWTFMNTSDGKFNSYTENAIANISTSSIPAGNYTLQVRVMSGAPRTVLGKPYYPLNGLMSSVMSRYVEVN